jgi:hypothetical protein
MEWTLPLFPRPRGEDCCDRGFPSRKTSDDAVLLPLASIATMPLIARVLRDSLPHAFPAASSRLVSSAKE